MYLRQAARALLRVVRWSWATRLRRNVARGVAVLGVLWAVSDPINEATGGQWFDILFPWRDGNSPPRIEKIYARERGQEIEPVVPRGGGIFLHVIATDPDGDEIIYEWVSQQGYFDPDPPSNQSSNLVFYRPLRQAGDYIVTVRVRDQVHKDFNEGRIVVTVVDPLSTTFLPTPIR
jgi:hypothetical protein